MIINKTTSDAVLVHTLVVIDDDGKPIKNVIEFDTDTKKTTLAEGGPVTAMTYMFQAATSKDQGALYELLDEDMELSITLSDKKHKAQKAMDAVASADDYLTFNSFSPSLQLYISTCSNCSTKFLLFIDDNGDLWSGEKHNSKDVFQTLVQVDSAGLKCDSCGNSVSVFDENPL